MPPTPTTDLGLLKPDEDDLYNIGIPNSNMDILEAVGAAPQRVTSSTRPSTPVRRQVIIETDTGRIMQWDGDSWEIVYAPPTIPAVLIGGKRYDGADNTLTTLPNSTAETLSGMDTGSLALVANTAYRVVAVVEWDSSVAADRFDFRIRQTDVTGTIIGLKQNVLFQTSGVREQLYLEAPYYRGGTDGSVTFVLTMQRRSGTGTGRIYRTVQVRPSIRVERLGATSLLAQT